MSLTSFEPATPRLHRSELAAPASNPKMIDKPSRSIADVVFLDLEDSVAPDEVARARRIVEAMEQAAREGRGAVQFDGRMIDIANIRMAQRLLAKADAITRAGR
jgi:malyl-CoA/(S)-citramalyl-CoA lyase